MCVCALTRLPSSPQREFKSTAKTELRKPTSHAAFFSAPRSRAPGPRFGMVTQDTIDEATYA